MEKEDGKTLKQYCKEAKKRLKEGFWKNYQENLSEELKRAEEEGLSASKVKDYYIGRIEEKIKSKKEDGEEFYQRVKKLLLEEGEVSDAIGRLTDKEYFETLDYDEKQRYTLSLSERYIQAVERFRKEQAIGYKAQ